MVQPDPDRMTEPTTFGERFAFARWFESGHVRDETDEEFAAALGMAKSSVSAWRKAVEPPPSSTCHKIADRTQVDPGWLISGERSQAPEPSGFRTFLAVRRARGRESAAAATDAQVIADAKRGGAQVADASKVQPAATRPAAKKKGKRAG